MPFLPFKAINQEAHVRSGSPWGGGVRRLGGERGHQKLLNATVLVAVTARITLTSCEAFTTAAGD